MAMQRAEVRKGDAMGTGRLLRCLWNMVLGWFVDGLLMDCINHRTTDEGRRWWFHVVSCPKIGSFCQLLNIPQNPHSPHSHISIRKHQITIAGALLDEFNIRGGEISFLYPIPKRFFCIKACFVFQGVALLEDSVGLHGDFYITWLWKGG